MTQTADIKTSAGGWTALFLVTIALSSVVARQFEWEIGSFLDDHVSLWSLTLDVEDQVLQLLMVPLASLTVVFCRITLGLRMLGPFRPILIAIAIQETGVILGTAFLIVVLTVVVAIRPRLRGGWLPYFGRLSLMLSAVVVVLVAVILIGAGLDHESLQKLAFFPIVVLTLTADGFASSLDKEGMPSAVARAAATVVTAVLINLMVSIAWVHDTLFTYPELVLVEIALILIVATRLRIGMLEKLNPKIRGKGEG